MEALEIPTIAVGAIVAAVVGGIITLLGLIISKEQKTSEFRQAWIDALRGEIASYITSVNAIVDAIAVDYDGHAKKVEALSPLYAAMNTATFNIMLRLNPDETLSKRVLDSMAALHALMSDESKLTSTSIRSSEANLLAASQLLLKSEWRRVKGGELTFKFTKIFASIVVAAALATAIWVAASALGRDQVRSSIAHTEVRAAQVPEGHRTTKTTP